MIVAINGQHFNSLEAFNERVAAAKPGSTVALLVRRGEGSVYVPVTVGQG